ncbi:unnamed protein product [Symbiodinium microadriaticum]|nr:unnamed protein product [Symbiodinium microadriaticum]
MLRCVQTDCRSARPAETHVPEGGGSKDPFMPSSWVPKLASKAKNGDLETESLKKEEDTVSEAVQDTVPSPHGETSLRPVFPTLTELQSQVDRQLLHATSRNHWQVLEENIKLSRDLRMARAELETGEMRECWQEEVEFWKREVMNLEAEIQEQRKNEEEVTELTSSAKVAEVPTEVRSEVVALSRAERELAELAREQARCEAAAKEVEGRNATLRRSLKQSGLERGGAARLFVNALPALDAQAVEVARTAVNVHMQKMKLQSQAAKRTLMAGEDTDIVVALLVSGRIMPYSKSDMSMERDADLWDAVFVIWAWYWFIDKYCFLHVLLVLRVARSAGPHRFFRRLDATGGVDSFLEELTERLEDAVAGLHGRQLDPTLGRVCSYIEPGGFIHEHRDRYHAQTDGLAHLRANIVVQMEPSGRPIIAGKSVPVNQRDAWIFFASRELHSTEVICGPQPRIVYGFGWPPSRPLAPASSLAVFLSLTGACRRASHHGHETGVSLTKKDLYCSEAQFNSCRRES